MGWNYEITLDFGNRINAGQRFLQLAEVTSASAKFWSMVELIVYDYELYLRKERDRAILEKHEDLEPSIYADFASRFADGNCLISSRWTVNRYYPAEHGQEAEIEQVAVEFRVFDAAFDFLRSNPATGVIYDAGDYKRYYVTRTNPEIAAQNFDMLLKELAIFIDAGVKAFWGLDADQNADKRRWSLIYYRNPVDFLHDLETMFDDVRITPELNGKVAEKVIKAAQNCDNVGFITPEQGIIIYSKLGTNGDLKEFYQSLHEVISFDPPQ